MKIFQGTVISTKLEKTAKVKVTRMFLHPMYRKRVKRTENYLVHDEIKVVEGDVVRFVASKPYSKMKKWIITEKVVNKKK